MAVNVREGDFEVVQRIERNGGKVCDEDFPVLVLADRQLRGLGEVMSKARVEGQCMTRLTDSLSPSRS